MARARTIAEVIAGEATSGSYEERMADMMNIASVISNRAQQLGVSMDDVVSAKTRNGYQFSAYNHPLPAGVGQDIIDMAQQAIDEVAATGPVNNATFYATPSAVDGLPDNLSFETSTTGHQYFSDPLGRSINTAVGLKTPNQYAYAANIEDVPTPTQNPSAIPTTNPAFLAGAQLQNVDPNLALAVPDAITNLPAADLATAQQFERAAPATNPWGGAPLSNVTAQGVLSGTSPMQAATSTQNNGVMAGLQSDGFNQMAAAGPFGGDYAAPEDRFGPSTGVMSGIPAGQQITQADVDRGLFNATAANEMDPSFTEALMGPQSAVVPTAVETTSITPGQASEQVASNFDASRFGPDVSNPGVMAGIDTSGFDASRFGPDVASFDQSRFGDVPAATFDQARFGQPQIDVATNTQSFVDQPANLGSMPDAYAAQRQAPTGVNSAEMDAMRGHIAYEMMKADQARQAAVNVPASGVLAGVPGMEAQTAAQVSALNSGVMANPAMAAPNFSQALNPSLPGLASTPVDLTPGQAQEVAQASQIPGVLAGINQSPVTAYADEAAPAPAVAAIEAQTAVPGQATSSALLSPTSIASMNPTLTPAVSNGMLPGQPINQVGFLPDLPANVDINLSGNIVPTADDVVAAPDLETVEVADQPTVTNTPVSIPGPATTSATDQQAQVDAKTAITAPTTTTKTAPAATDKGVLSGLFSKEALGGGVLAGLLGGPMAAPLGVLAGTAVANGGGLTGLLSTPSFSQPTSQIAGGVSNIAGLYSGAQPAGTYAVANNGATITAQPGGYTTYSNKFGVTEAIGPDGKISGYFGSGAQPADQEAEASNSGGFFGGLFG